MHDHDPIDFEMTDLATRPGPCRKATAEETDATAARLAREVEAAPFIAEAVFVQHGRNITIARRVADDMRPTVAVEVKHGSGKVKV